MERLIPIDDQPMDASFFGEARRLTEFITPNALDVQELYKKLTNGINDPTDRITACWKWVASRVKYVEFVKGQSSMAK